MFRRSNFGMLARKQRPVSHGLPPDVWRFALCAGSCISPQRYSAILEEQLAETNGRFRLLVEEVRDYALFTMDPTGRVTSWNGGAERMLGYVEADIVGQNFSCFFTPEDIQNRVPEKQLREALEAGEAEDEGWRVRGNREQFWADVSITALLEHAGPFGGFAIVMQDVTDRRRIAIVLEEARQERTRLQEKFLSHVSHELRTPLTAIYFFMTNVLDGVLGDLTPEQREHLTFALDNVKQLKDMVSDLLDITRVETHKLIVEPRQASPVKLIAEAISTCGTNAATKNISLRFEAAPDLPFVWADPVRVRQILINLIDNGIKFTPESGTLTVACRRFAEDDGFVCLSVSDTGCGISPENREIVFDRLAQIKSWFRSKSQRSGSGAVHFKGAGVTARRSNLGGKPTGTRQHLLLYPASLLTGQTVCPRLHRAKLGGGFCNPHCRRRGPGRGSRSRGYRAGDTEGLGALHSSWSGCALAVDE